MQMLGEILKYIMLTGVVITLVALLIIGLHAIKELEVKNKAWQEQLKTLSERTVTVINKPQRTKNALYK